MLDISLLKYSGQLPLTFSFLVLFIFCTPPINHVIPFLSSQYNILYMVRRGLWDQKGTWLLHTATVH